MPTYKIKRSAVCGDAEAAAPDDPEAELATAEAERGSLQQRLNDAQERVAQAERGLGQAKAAHLAVVGRRLDGDAAADVAATRATLADAEDIVAALRLAVADAITAQQPAEVRYQPLAEAARRRRLSAEQAQLATTYRAALQTARACFKTALDAVGEMEQALNALAASDSATGRGLANALRQEADGLPLVTGTFRVGQVRS